MEELGMESSFSVSAAAADDEGFSVPVYHRKKQLRTIKKVLASSQPMSEEEASRKVNLWSDQLTVEDRVRLYLFWKHSYEDCLRRSVRTQADEYKVASQELRELRMGEDKNILEEATIIGMTTTGAARYRRVLTTLRCPIVMLEEAAEVLEAHAVTTLHQTCQHLILIGDHRQLRPSPTVYELSIHYKLDLSLFERLINNGLHHSTLGVQHRMRPEVSQFLKYEELYPALQDHGTTLDRDHIRGMKQDVFLFHHEVQESQSNETGSKSNVHEAELCVRLCRYLLQQDYPPTAITILTAYSGQVFALKNAMNDQLFYKGVRVTTVDNYQGEESDIIILSLVRSNHKGAVGFLGTDNRVCVALSRARNGLYAFGNFVILSESSSLWKKICKTAKDNGQLGNTLTLHCENHPDQEITVTTAQDFDQMPEGGCKLPCGTRLDCGHVCERSCHGYDRAHETYKCQKKCERITCSEGHPCNKQCFKDCGKCEFKVTKTVPMCGHEAEIACHRDPYMWNCNEQCKGKLPCGHQCSGKCGECRKQKCSKAKCTVVEEKVWPCGHLVPTLCHVTPGELPCKEPCKATLSCSHTCPGTCGLCWGGRVHVPCKAKCSRPLPGCGHECLLPCGMVCLPCFKTPCPTSCDHSRCMQPCGAPCNPCVEECPWKSCEHKKCSALCHDPCSPCGKACSKKKGVSCGTKEDPHHCWGQCGEKCFCFVCDREDNFRPLAIGGVETEGESVEVGADTQLIKLPGCGHIFKTKVLDVYMMKKLEKTPPGERILCPDDSCKKEIQNRDCWRYHQLFQQRHNRFHKIKVDVQQKTTIPPSGLQKLQQSLSMVTHDAEQHKSFASKCNQGQVFKDGIVNLNMARALANQMRMAAIFDKCCDVTKDFRALEDLEQKALIADLEVLQRLLYKPVKHMSAQRTQELTAATKRFAYMTKLIKAKELSCSQDLTQQIDRAFTVLKKTSGTESFQETETLLLQCATKCLPLWRQMTKGIDISSLDQPLDEYLLEPVQKPESTGKPGAAGKKPSSDKKQDSANTQKPASKDNSETSARKSLGGRHASAVAEKPASMEDVETNRKPLASASDTFPQKPLILPEPERSRIAESHARADSRSATLEKFAKLATARSCTTTASAHSPEDIGVKRSTEAAAAPAPVSAYKSSVTYFTELLGTSGKSTTATALGHSPYRIYAEKSGPVPIEISSAGNTCGASADANAMTAKSSARSFALPARSFAMTADRMAEKPAVPAQSFAKMPETTVRPAVPAKSFATTAETSDVAARYITAAAATERYSVPAKSYTTEDAVERAAIPAKIIATNLGTAPRRSYDTTAEPTAVTAKARERPPVPPRRHTMLAETPAAATRKIPAAAASNYGMPPKSYYMAAENSQRPVTSQSYVYTVPAQEATEDCEEIRAAYTRRVAAARLQAQEGFSRMPAVEVDGRKGTKVSEEEKVNPRSPQSKSEPSCIVS